MTTYLTTVIHSSQAYNKLYMGQALYRKHRPKSLQEVIGQEHITETLAKALEQGRISHAYLFTGPRGTGKTSIARILAHEINGLPYTDDGAHMDIIEIDAASNRRIDEIRELRDKVYVAPTSAKYKVYIIDEVHMLTKEAFNALLKTLEEPPAHVVFILATTDVHKLPDTIISRTQRFTFRPADSEQVAVLLRDIAKSEKLAVSPEALQLLAEHGQGSFRDSVSLLDQAGGQGGAVEASDVQALLGIPSAEAVQALVQALTGVVDTPVMMTQLNDLYNSGYQATTIAKQISQLVRNQLVAGETLANAEWLLELLAQLIEVPLSHDPERFLEITLLRAQTEHTAATAQPIAARSPERLPAAAKTKATTAPAEKVFPEVSGDSPADDKPEASPPAKAAAASKLSKPKVAGNAPFDATIWPEVLQALKQKHNTLYSVVRIAQPSFDKAGSLQLAFAFAFHEKQVRESANRQLLIDTILELTGETVTIECLLDKAALPPKPSLAAPAIEHVPPPTADLATISNIFGGGELLES
jgi:DNA polymerase III subunit gamma/tau